MKAFLGCAILLLSFSFFLSAPPSARASVDHSAYSSADYEKCAGCHPMALPTHKRLQPTNMTENYPLDPSGKITCITCHNCVTGTCLLRKPKNELCAVCHDCTRGMACLIGVAHMGNSKDIKALVQDCLVCHDGTTGKLAGGPDEHAVDVLYLSGGDFNPVTDRRVVFVDGKVTCISCHNPYATDTARLSKDNTESRLCMTCHKK